jgi:phosphoglycerate dehydrogenase-like enzyme
MAILDDWERVAAQTVDWAGELPDVEVTIFTDHLRDEAALCERLTPFDIVMVMRERTPVSAALVAGLPRLQLLVTTGMRNRAVDVGAALARDVIVCGTPGLQWAAPELTWALILAVARRIPDAHSSMRAGEWAPTVGLDLHGARLGLLGLGRLGGQVAQVGRAFGMELIAWSPHLTAERAAEHGATLVSKADLFRRADVISIHMVLAESTRGIVGADELALMKPDAILVNTSRGPLIDEAALLTALRDGRLAGAGLDVYAEEPLPGDHPLRTAPGVVLTPHLGYVTRQTFDSFYQHAAEDVQAFLRGQPIRRLTA